MVVEVAPMEAVRVAEVLLLVVRAEGSVEVFQAVAVASGVSVVVAH
jgi:hypothetical protein